MDPRTPVACPEIAESTSTFIVAVAVAVNLHDYDHDHDHDHAHDYVLATTTDIAAATRGFATNHESPT